MKNCKIVIAGGSGFIGMQLAEKWAKHNTVTILTRNVKDAQDNSYGAKASIPCVQMLQWDGKTTGSWVAALEDCDLLLNLAGQSVNCRYTGANRARILNSRVDSTTALGMAVMQLKNPPRLWINSASTTIYRHAEDRPQDEATGQVENDFSVKVCKQWEAAFNAIPLAATRKVVLRIAIVLGRGGVLVPYARLARLGLGGPQGSGRQMFSWIHIDDLAGIIEWLYDHPAKSGVYNAAAPGPVPNHELMRQLRRICGMPVGIPAPAWLLRIAAAIIGTAPELLLKSRWVVPTRLLQDGYSFAFPELSRALTSLLTAPAGQAAGHTN